MSETETRDERYARWSDGLLGTGITSSAFVPIVAKALELADAEAAAARAEHLAFTDALGFGDGVTEPAATLAQMIDPIREAYSDAQDHIECPRLCEGCGEQLAVTECPQCHGGGCLPNAAMAYLECDTCAGVGRIHEGCVEESYVDLVAQRDIARHDVERLTHLLGSHADGHRCTCAMTDPGKPGIEPPEWEQNPWCPTHPDVDYIAAELSRLRGVVEAVQALADRAARRGITSGPPLTVRAVRAALAPVSSSGEAESGYNVPGCTCGFGGFHEERNTRCALYVTPAPVPSGGQAEAVEALLESDAMTPNSEGTPTHYIVDAENVGYLVGVVLAAARPVLSREALRERLGEHRMAAWREVTPDRYARFCSCGHQLDSGEDHDTFASHLDHLADVLDGGQR